MVPAMRALVVYESMYGNTHTVAEGIGDGLRAMADVTVVPVARVGDEDLSGVDLLVVGGPTHIHGVTTSRSRQTAIEAAAAPESDLTTDPDAEGPGLREWLDGLEVPGATKAAAFDTRIDGPALLTGRASRGIARRLRGLGLEMIAPPESFLVDRGNHLKPGVAEAARAWGQQLGRSRVDAAGTSDAPAS
jgi:hypothetical protein